MLYEFETDLSPEEIAARLNLRQIKVQGRDFAGIYVDYDDIKSYLPDAVSEKQAKEILDEVLSPGNETTWEKIGDLIESEYNYQCYLEEEEQAEECRAA